MENSAMAQSFEARRAAHAKRRANNAAASAALVVLELEELIHHHYLLLHLWSTLPFVPGSAEIVNAAITMVKGMSIFLPPQVNGNFLLACTGCIWTSYHGTICLGCY
jgi:hypothetical protein